MLVAVSLQVSMANAVPTCVSSGSIVCDYYLLYPLFGFSYILILILNFIISSRL